MIKRRWRDYQTATGRRPVKEFLEVLSDEDVAAVTTAMKEAKDEGLRSARHLGNGIYEIRANGNRVIYRLLFAPQGRRGQVLLALAPFKKKTQKTPPQMIRLAERRLQDWERKGAELRTRQI
ncbi:MAG TPA: type II toxin-antitoxin system RelE/ParE family toxin [Solirubrobacterales bacterium]|nr:type II toxin-antitoxin system RelE/ParE family toxin [Solirubrobacterales bacterium]